MGKPIRLAALVATMAWSTHAGAQSPLTLDWKGGAECADGTEVVREVDRILASSSGARRPVSATAEVNRASSGALRVQLVTSGPDVAGRRTFEATSCREIVAACALILALTVNPQLSSPTEENVAEPPPVAAPVPVAPEQGTTREAPARPNRFGASVSLAGDIGSLPGAVPGVELAFVFVERRFRLEAVGRLWASSRQPVRTNAGADFDLFLAGVRGGYALLKTRAMSVGPSLGVEVDHTRASGFGGTRAFSPSATTLAANAGVLSTWAPFASAPSFALRLLVEGVVPFHRPEFVVQEPSPTPASAVHHASFLAGRATLGAELLFF